MADILPINTWFCFDFVSGVHRVPFNNVQLQVYIIKIKIVLYTQLSQLSHISLELSKRNIITMCCHTMYLEKKCYNKPELLSFLHVTSVVYLLRRWSSWYKHICFLWTTYNCAHVREVEVVFFQECIFFWNNVKNTFFRGT
jgi:hypothetical protein